LPEAYLEGMKTEKGFPQARKKMKPEAYLEGMKTRGSRVPGGASALARSLPRRNENLFM